MTKQESIDYRQSQLQKFLTKKRYNPPTLDEIQEFYKGSNIKSSTINLRRDLQAISASCDKSNGNIYFLPSNKDIIATEKEIVSLLNKCVIFKPVSLSSPLALSSKSIGDNLTNLTLYGATIKCRCNTDSETIPDLKHIFSKYNSLTGSKIFSSHLFIIESNTSLLFIFDSKKRLEKFYTHIHKLTKLVSNI